MIEVREQQHSEGFSLSGDEFENAVLRGDIPPQAWIRYPAITGDDFRAAHTLEIYTGLLHQRGINLREHFHLRRIPALTLTFIVVLMAVYFVWQDGAPRSTDDLMRQGAKSPELMRELGQWYRLLWANLLHVSTWHLLMNCFFLFNLGGVAEAVFRRRDVLSIILASALGTTLLSSWANPVVSCGASGIVFGIWAAVAIFGLRHRDVLPQKYRRYFLLSVGPYALFALYLGFVMDNIDIWGHFGGTMAGMVFALFIPSRLAENHRGADVLMWASFAAAVLVLLVSNSSAPDAGPLSITRYFPKHGIAIPAPIRWKSILRERSSHREAYAFGNRAMVVAGFEARRFPKPLDLETAAKRFVNDDIGEQINGGEILGMKVEDPSPSKLDSLRAQRIEASIRTQHLHASVTYIIAVRGYYRYVISLSAPTWVRDQYEVILQNILHRAKIIDLELQEYGGYNIAESDLARAWKLAYQGQSSMAQETFEALYKAHPNSADVQHDFAQFLMDHREDPQRVCRLSEGAYRRHPSGANLLNLVRALPNCNQDERAKVYRFELEEKYPNLAQRLGDEEHVVEP